MSAGRTRLYSACDKIIEYMLYTLVFFIPFSKSVVEVFATLSVMIWLYKNGLKTWEWVLEKKAFFVPPKTRSGVFRVLAPTAAAVVFLVYSSVVISMGVVTRHFEIEGDLFAPKIFIPITLFAALLIAVFLVIISAVNRGNYGFSLKASILSFIGITLVTSSFTTHNLSLSAEAFLFKTMEYVLIFLMMAELIDTPRKVFNVVSIFLLAAFFTGLDGIFQRLTGYDLFRKFPLFEKVKITAAFKAPNDFGTYLATMLPLPLAFIAFSAAAWKKKIGFLLLSLLIASCLMLTFARGAWLGFLAGFLFLFVFGGGKRFTAALIILALSVSLTALFAPPLIKEQLSSFAKLGSDLSSTDRVSIWKTGWRMFLDRPVFGHGLNTFMSVFERYKPPEYKEIVYAHNCFLQTAAETGILGLLIFLWFCGSIVFRALFKFFRSSDRLVKTVALGTAAGIIATLANSFVDTNLYSLPLAVLFWSLSGVAAARVQSE